jgi:hypothetical protein
MEFTCKCQASLCFNPQQDLSILIPVFINYYKDYNQTAKNKGSIKKREIKMLQDGSKS